MTLLYKYNEDKTFKSDVLVNALDDILIKTYKEKQIIDGEEIIIELPLETPVLPEGITDTPLPKNMPVYPNISPKFIDDEWVEDKEAVEAYLATLVKPKKLMTLEQMDELLTYLAGGKL